MAEFMDFDPLTGISHYFEHDDLTNETKITYVQDVEKVLDYTKAVANDGMKDGGIKRGFWLYAKIPPVVEIAMRAKGIRLNDPSATKRIVQEINENYPHFKVTQKKHGTGVKQIYVPD